MILSVSPFIALKELQFIRWTILIGFRYPKEHFSDLGFPLRMKKSCLLEIAFDEKPERPLTSRVTLISPETHSIQRVCIFENSALKIERAVKEDSWRWRYPKEKIKLHLSAGGILGNTSDTSTNREFELTFTNGFVTFSTNALYSLTASGEIAVARGTASIFLADKNLFREVESHHSFDPASGVVRQMSADELRMYNALGLPIGPEFEAVPLPTIKQGMGGSMRKF